jgi:hypothetical protein
MKTCKTCDKPIKDYYTNVRKFCSYECYWATLKNPLNNGESFQCSKCKEVKPKAKFVRSRNRKTGYSNYCKKCINLMNKQKMENPEFREWKRKYTKENYEPARNMAYKKKTELMKDKCEKCGVTEKLQMHHPDYRRPFEVKTLCAQCHADITWNYA